MQNEKAKKSNFNAKTLTTASKFYTYLNNLLIISPRRRLGIWRRVFGEKGESKKCFVSISGDSVLEPECFGVAKRELSILEEKGVSLRGYNSSLNNIMDLKPFSDFKGHDMHSLSYWYVPNSVKHQYYVNYNLNRLSDWQVDTLSQILNFMVVEKDRLIGKWDNIFTDNSRQNLSPYLIVSPDVCENLTICEIVALNSLLYSGGNILAIFPNPQKCDAYYQRCKYLFGINSLNLRIELFGQSSRSINKSWFPNIDLTICTLEKSNSLINRLISDNMLSECIKTIIIDDINFVGDPEKGHLLENILTKISYLNLVNDFYTKNNYFKGRNGPLTCLYVSNEKIPNLEIYTDVLKVGKIFENYRYEKEREPDVYIKRGNNVFFWNKVKANQTSNKDEKYEIFEIFENDKNNNSFQKTAISDLKYFSDLILESLISNKKALVFCPTIEWCKKSLQTISMEILEIVSNKDNSMPYKYKHLKNNQFGLFANQITQDRPLRINIIEKLKKVSKNGSKTENDLLLFDGILNYGIAIHNSKFSFKERKIIEDAFKNNHLKILFCTSLHMMDSEIKADRIIIRSIGLGKINNLTKKKTGNREWISKNTLKQFFGRISHPNSDITAKTRMHASSNICTSNWAGDGFKMGIFIFTGDDLEFKYLDNLLNDANFQSLEFLSHLSELNLFRLILELIQTDLVREIGGLELLISRLTFRGKLEGSNFNSIFDIFAKDYQKIPRVFQFKGLNEDMLLSISFMAMNQLVFFSSGKENYDINEISISSKYVQQFQDKFGHLKSPIVSSKYALIGSKTKDKLNKSITAIIIKQNDFLAKLGSGKKYLLSFFNAIGPCIGNSQIIGTCLASALVQSQLHPCIVLEIYSDLIKSKLLGLDLSNNLQIYILGLLAYNGSHLKVNWSNYLQIFSELTPREILIADFYGVNFKVISEIVRTVTSNSNLIPDLSKLSPVSIQHSYFYSETLNFKGVIEKYRLISIYRFYYACFLRDLCNPMMTFELIMAKYSIDSNAIKLIVSSFSLSINTVSSLCKSIGWIDLGEIIFNIKNHLESSISIRNVKYLYKITQEQNHYQMVTSPHNTTNGLPPATPLLNDYHLDQQDISRIMNYVNMATSLNNYITPNIAISFYFSGLNCIENIATASKETLLRSIQNANKLDDYFGQFTNKPPEPNLNLMVICQEIVQQARKVLSQSENLHDIDSLSNSDVYTENHEIDIDLNDLDLDLVQNVGELTAKSEYL
ncbi:DNA polymerase theta [Cryptosporidium ubiquitum]|uniref:DNA polymerase theta n=1 Tax=Cryptosporidium ubiquitum TaxID=857276 RepID=A0A1J4MIA8_9CRYT|nr:DNA polymerase theta [Cryptosporidium ubiquitum]OII73944.1 DNA polymerase theta [Cryptosporidium ubiquitum]